MLPSALWCTRQRQPPTTKKTLAPSQWHHNVDTLDYGTQALIIWPSHLSGLDLFSFPSSPPRALQQHPASLSWPGVHFHTPELRTGGALPCHSPRIFRCLSLQPAITRSAQSLTGPPLAQLSAGLSFGFFPTDLVTVAGVRARPQLQFKAR